MSSALSTKLAWWRPPLDDDMLDSALQCARPWRWVHRFPMLLSHFCVDGAFEWVQARAHHEHGRSLLEPTAPPIEMPNGNRRAAAIFRGGFDAVAVAAQPLLSMWLPLLV
eukprot:4414489-Prymnesium_polylepis.1